MDLILKQCNLLFKQEWGMIVEQYNTMRNQLYTAEQSLFLCEGQKFFLEQETAALKQYINDYRPQYLPDYVVDFAPDPEKDPNLDEEAVNQANCVLEKPLSFYGGYVMEVMYKKNEVLT